MSRGRRRFLRDVAVAGGGAALLPALLPFTRSTVRASEPGSPRFVFVVEGNCVEPVAMLSTSARAALDEELASAIDDKRNWYRDYRHDALLEIPTSDFDTAKSLGSLGSLASRASVIYGLSNKVGGGGHTPYHGTLTCTRTVGGSPGGESIDAYLARQLVGRYETPFDAVRLGAGSAPLNGGTCASGPGVTAAILQRATTAYQTFVGAVAGDPTSLDQAEVLAFAREDVEHELEGTLATGDERQKLVAYRDALSQAQAQLDALVGWEADASLLPPTPDEDARFQSSRHFDQLGAQFDVATAALRLGLTNVAVITSATAGEFGGVRYPSLARSGVPEGRHQLHHESAGSAAHQDMIHEVSGTIVDNLVRMATAFEATPDGDAGTLLDHTLIVYLGDNGETHHSSASEFPIFLLGGESLGFRHGRTLVYPRSSSAEHRRLSNLWMSLAAGAGAPRDTFGAEDFTRVIGGELPALRG